jgi:hypothetical protein
MEQMKTLSLRKLLEPYMGFAVVVMSVLREHSTIVLVQFTMKERSVHEFPSRNIL